MGNETIKLCIVVITKKVMKAVTFGGRKGLNWDSGHRAASGIDGKVSFFNLGGESELLPYSKNIMYFVCMWLLYPLYFAIK